MNKTETIDHIARSADLSKEAAGRAMDAFEARLKAHISEGKLAALRSAITTSMRECGIFSFYGFGRFHVGRRSARSGRNPHTGASVLIRAARVPRSRASKTGNAGGRFSAGERLKAALN